MCEKCWGDSYHLALADTSKSQPDHYHDLLRERLDTPCTPEKQCGDMHAIKRWTDGTEHCVCGKVCRYVSKGGDINGKVISRR